MEIVIEEQTRSGIKGLFVNYRFQIILMRILLDVCFRKYVVYVFGTSNYKYAFSFQDNIGLYFLSWLVLVFSIIISEKWFKSGLTSNSVIIYIYFIQFVPFTTMIGYSCFPMGYCIYTILYWLVLAGLVRIFLQNKGDGFEEIELFDNSEESNKKKGICF